MMTVAGLIHSRHNANAAPGSDPGCGAVSVTKLALGLNAGWYLAGHSSHSLGSRVNRSYAFMSSNRPVDIRGREHRRVLLAIVLRCAERGCRLPQYRVLGLALGIDRSQVSRHLKRLRAEGAYVELPAGHWRRRATTIRNRHLRIAA